MKLKIFACAVCALLLFGCGEKEAAVQTTTSVTEGTTTTTVSTEGTTASTVVSETDDVTESTTVTTETEQTESVGETTTTVTQTTTATRGTTGTTAQVTTTTAATTATAGNTTATTERTKKTKFSIKPTSVVALTEIEMEPSEVTLLVGETKTLTATAKPKNASERIVWHSSNSAVATVAEDGTVTAVALGEAVITAEGEYGVSASCRVSVCEVALDLQEFPMELMYKADYSKTVAICLQMTDVEAKYTADKKELELAVYGWISYATDGSSLYTTPEFGWRVIDGESVVAEGVCVASEQGCVGCKLGVSRCGYEVVTVSGVQPGRYRLELYSTYKK